MRLAAFLIVLTVLRLVMIGQMELSPDEAYYHEWSQRLDWCYFSKGPGVALAMRAGTTLFGHGEFGVRFLAPMLALGTSLLVFWLARRLYDERTAIWTVVLLNVTPLFNAGGLLMTIDPLSIFFWTAAMYAFWMALEHTTARDEPDGLGSGWSFWWPVTGALIGLGFLCKWTNAIQLVSILALLLSSIRFRSHFRRPGFWSLLLVFVLFTIPPLLWNADHQWITFSHVSHRGGLDQAWKLSIGEPFVFIGLHLGVYSPGLFAAMMIALQGSLHRVRDHFKPRFLVAFSAPLLLMYLILSFKKAGQANWTSPAMLSLGVLTAAHWHERALGSKAVRRFIGVSLAVALLLSTLILDMDLIRTAGIPWPYKRDPSARLRGWQSTALEIHELRKRVEEPIKAPVFLIG